MSEYIGANVIRFVAFIMAQIWIFNAFYFNIFGVDVGLILVYVLFVMLLPIDMPRWVIIIVAFVMGITVDVFSDSPGVHASATVMLAFGRKYVLDGLEPRGGYKINTIPSIRFYGLSWFLRYTAWMVLILVLAYFIADVFRLKDFGIILLKSAFSFVTTFIVASLTTLVLNPSK